MSITPDARILALDVYDDGALAQMCQHDGYLNLFTGETLHATTEELADLFNYRQERYARWETEHMEQVTTSAAAAYAVSDTYSDTMALPLYDMKDTAGHHHIVSRYGVALAVAEMLYERNMLDDHADIIRTIITKLDAGDTTPTPLDDTTVTVKFHSN